MSVLIKIDMPKSCDVCDFMRTNDDLMSADYRYMYCGFPGMGDYVTDYTQCRLAKCPLLEVQAHGRLIDADTLKQNTYEIYDPLGIIEAVPVDVIDNAPTVIEAEE